ncbi:Cc.Cdc5 protein [Schizopora paradoxa]|uniref:Pre-mRNA-splicing factor CEF1 n=1 Tax=Schizopora paradoxa TaxID=27342 RepID=A0A0H2RDI3_9AGAM|nr:Cc.Cdc5 protein [Schizopora paradoxa]
MVRIIIKGGVWKNTEDEVLKAAIAKYGKNQWARISSLLVRKTPKQCKARWYEWLDPSIKKTEWSKTEDEKLLHLAKLMPTQWRTIAPIVGRTATQCLERYQKLLDEAEAKENEELGLAGPSEAGPGIDDVRKLRPGEIDPDPETKPARPDPIDMDEDEKEMLSEARARLANTQGKKAKRKARERQLEEARRLAMLQKKRELKAAGIIGSMRHKSKKKGMDYNADIPFEKKPAAGFYDTSEEQAKQTTAPIGQTLRRLENKRKPEDEEAERKKRQRRGKDGETSEHQTKFIAARDAQIQKLKEAEQISKRRKLELPAAQVGEAELEEIVKIGLAGESARALVGEGSEASERLLGEYDGFDRAKMARTPRTAPLQDNIMTEARNLRNMTVQQTPLLGDENTPLHQGPGGGTGFEGATPRHQVTFTPNPLLTPARQQALIDGTPRSESMAGATPLRTPLRDNLSLNPEDAVSRIGDTPRERRMRESAAARSLKSAFMSLPKPENNFELEMPEDDADEETISEEIEEDAAERDARIKRRQEEERRKELARRSQVVQRGLPRPARIDVGKLLEELSVIDDGEDDVAAANRLVTDEMVRLLQHDAISFPLPGTSIPGGTKSTYEHPDDDAVEQAKAAIDAELALSLGFPDARPDQIKEGLAAAADSERLDDSLLWSSMRDRLVYDVKSKRFVEPDSLTQETIVEGFDYLLQDDRETMAKEASRTAKSEKKLGVQLGGYEVRSKALSKRIVDAFDEIQKVTVDLACFSKLSIDERVVGPRRLETLKSEVTEMERREKSLQERYQELVNDKQETEARIAALEEKVMMEAEALNEEALAAMEAEGDS